MKLDQLGQKFGKSLDLLNLLCKKLEMKKVKKILMVENTKVGYSNQ